jgi:hypothetical protein
VELLRGRKKKKNKKIQRDEGRTKRKKEKGE